MEQTTANTSNGDLPLLNDISAYKGEEKLTDNSN